MDRRRFLAVATASLSAATAGCNAPGGTAQLGSPEEQLDADGREKHLIFSEGDRQVAVITMTQRSRVESPTEPCKLQFQLSHGSILQGNERSTTVEALQLDLRTPTGPNQVPAEIYLKVPQTGLADRISFEDVEETWTRVAAADLGLFGEGSLSLETIISPVAEPVEEIGVRAAATLSEPGLTGSTYQLEGKTRFSRVIRS